MIFKKPKNALEGHGKPVPRASEIAHEASVACGKCKKILTSDELESEMYVCPYCRYHFKINARQRIHMVADTDTFILKKDLPKALYGSPIYRTIVDNKVVFASSTSTTATSAVVYISTENTFIELTGLPEDFYGKGTQHLDDIFSLL